VLSLALFSADNDPNCKCKFGDLLELEKLNGNYKRVRIENPNGIIKYPAHMLTYNAHMACLSLVLYELGANDNSTSRVRKCRKCLATGWTTVKDCESIKCDLDALSGDFSLQPINSNRILNDQNLFAQNLAVAVYKSMGNANMCKICQQNGEWSANANANLCTAPRKPVDCSFTTLKQFEYEQFDHIRIRVESANGLVKINEREVISDKLPSGTVVLYQKYLSSLDISLRGRNRVGKLNTGNYFNPFTKKFCRYCNDGAWSEIESCVNLSCDKELLTGSPELLFTNINQSNKLKPVSRYLSEQRQQQTLYKPGSVVAIYSFGPDKFCKQCHENGEWSKYSLPELCNATTSLVHTSFATAHHPISIY
jgi:hypothetical protein